MAHLMGHRGTATAKTMDSPVLATPALGTPSAGVMTNMTGMVEASMADNAITLAKMASGTDGNIISYDASGNPVAVATGTDGQVLTSAGAGAPPAFEAMTGGKIAKVIYNTDTSGDMNTTNATGTETIAMAPISFTTVSGRIYVIHGQQQLATSNESGSAHKSRILHFGLYYGTTSRSKSDTTVDTLLAHRYVGRVNSENTSAGRAQYIMNNYLGYFTAGASSTHYVYTAISDSIDAGHRNYGHGDSDKPHITVIYEILP